MCGRGNASGQGGGWINKHKQQYNKKQMAPEDPCPVLHGRHKWQDKTAASILALLAMVSSDPEDNHSDAVTAVAMAVMANLMAMVVVADVALDMTMVDTTRMNYTIRETQMRVRMTLKHTTIAQTQTQTMAMGMNGLWVLAATISTSI